MATKKKPATTELPAKKTVGPSHGMIALNRLTDELAVVKEQYKTANDIATVRMKRIEQLQKEHEEFANAAAAANNLMKMNADDLERSLAIEVGRRQRADAHRDEVQRELTAVNVALHQSASALPYRHVGQERVAVLEAFIRKSLHDGQINCTEASELLKAAT